MKFLWHKHPYLATTLTGLATIVGTLPLSAAYLDTKESRAPEHILVDSPDAAGYRHGVMVFVLDMPRSSGADVALKPIFDLNQPPIPTVLSYNPYYRDDGSLKEIHVLPPDVMVYDSRAQFEHEKDLIRASQGRNDKEFNRAGVFYQGADLVNLNGDDYAGRVDFYGNDPDQPPLTHATRAFQLGSAYLEAAIAYLQQHPEQLAHLRIYYWAPESGNPFKRKSAEPWYESFDRQSANHIFSGKDAFPYLVVHLQHLNMAAGYATQLNPNRILPDLEKDAKEKRTNEISVPAP